MATDIVLQNVVIRYPHLAAPWTGNPTIEADYQCQLILPQDWPHWGALQAAVDEAIQVKFGASVPANLKLPWLNRYLQPNLQADGPYQGCYYLNAKGKGTKPTIVDGNVEPIPDLQIKQAVFSGCIVNAYVNLGGYQVSDAGVGVYLKSIQLVDNRQEAIPDTGSADATAVFQAIPGAPAPIPPVQPVQGAQGTPAPFSTQAPGGQWPPQGTGGAAGW